jgi:predicted GNAT family acetyltransferase
MAKEDYAVTNNEKELHFEIYVDRDVAYLEYRFYNKDIALMHTVVPDSLSGKGVASALAHHALEWAKEHGKQVMVYCPFVAAYLKRHPEYDSILDKQYR